MKNRVEGSQGTMKEFRWTLLVVITGLALLGCRGNSSIIFPSDWNVESALSTAASKPGTTSALQAVAASTGLIGGLQRQPDCSLTYLDFSYAVRSTGATLVPHSQIPHYETTLHDSASLNTTADRFLSGCVDSSEGTTSRPFLFLGQDKDGQQFIALPGISGVVTAGIRSDGTYTPPVTLNTPEKSVSLLSGDLKREGDADLISINSSGQQSSGTVLLAQGDGTYQTGENYALPGANAQYGVLDDLNGDGIPDLIVSSDTPAFAFSIFIGNGDGTFQQPQTFVPETTNSQFNNAFITADVNGDGKKDIVTAQGQIFLGKGDGVSYSEGSPNAFQTTNTSTADFFPSIVAADFNHDGRIDLATDDDSVIRIFLGNGDGTFEAGPVYPTIQNSGLLTATDLDGDGNIDLWTGYGGNGIYSGDATSPDTAYAFMGNGDGTFSGTAGLPASLAQESAAMAHAIPDTTTILTLSSPVPSTITVAAGKTSAPFVVVLGTNTAQSVTLACSGLPVMATCVFPQAPFFLSGTVNSVPVNIEIATTANGIAIPSRRISWPLNRIFWEWWFMVGLLAAFVLLLRTPRRNLRWASSASFLVLTAALFAGCSSNSSSIGSASGGTPPGTYSVTITGIGASGTPISSPNTLTLKVTQ